MTANDTREPASTAALGFYDNYLEWKDWDPSQFGRYSALDARYFAAELGTSALSGGRALEIGFGNGSTLAWLKDMGAETYGVEANQILVERAARLLGGGRAFSDLHDDALSRLTNSFSLVVAFDVVEHVPLDKLGPMLAQMRELLASGGICVLRFPNGDSPFGRVNQHGDPTHVTTLGGARITYLAQRAGLVVEAIRAPALPTRGVGFARGAKRRLILGGRMLIEYAVGLLYFGGRRLPLDPNYIAVLRRP
jgi:SAM-dependent methyltransferase